MILKNLQGIGIEIEKVYKQIVWKQVEDTA